jgi:hypothetical protein
MLAYLIFQCRYIDSVNLTSTSPPAIIALVHTASYLEVPLFLILAPFSYIRFVLISYTLASIYSAFWLCPLETEFQG